MNYQYAPTEFAILILLLYYVILLIGMASLRTFITLTQDKKADDFDPSGRDVGKFGYILTRVHANTYESVPFILAVLIFAIAANASQVTDKFAMLLVFFRIGQGITHLISAHATAVKIRFLIFFLPQLVILIYWIINLGSALA